MLRALRLSVWLLASWLLLSAPARADDLADFEAARALYEHQDYGEAVAALRALVGSDPPRVTDPLLVLESRKYLAAALQFMGAAEDAKAQFRLLIAQEPTYTLDPLAFPTEVLALFERVKVDIQRELEERRKAEQAKREAAEKKLRDVDRVRLQNLTRLGVLASEAETRVPNSRLVATLPFGVGQFQNGHRGLGVTLAVTEGLSAASSIVTYAVHQYLSKKQPSPNQVPDAQLTEERWRTANYVSFGVFVGLALIGIIDAHVRFLHDRVTTRRRPLPPDLEHWVHEQGVAAGGAPVLRF